MSEIKFRAWDKKGKEMFRVIAISFPLGRNIIIVSGRGGSITLDRNKGWRYLMQYIGLRDRDGIAIAAGDIVIIPGARRAMQVVYQAPSFVMKMKLSDKTWSEFALGPEENQLQKIIGNIYENPELMGAK